MAKLFTADAAKRNFKKKQHSELFERAIALLNEDIQKASESKNSISVSTDDAKYKETLFHDQYVMNYVFSALADKGYELTGGMDPVRGYVVVLIEW